MESCHNCGHQLNPGQKFCPKCGAVQKREAAVPPPSALENRSREENRKGPSFFRSKKFKVLAAVIVILAIGLIGAYQYIASTMTPGKIQAQFVDAVKKQNVKEMKQILNKNQTELDLTDDAISNFLTYLKKHPDVYTKTVLQLKKDAGKLAVNKDYDDRKRPVSLVRDGKKWLVFDYYAINVKPYAVKLETDQDPVEISINGKAVGKLSKSNDTFGPYLLSDIEIKATYKGEYANVVKTESIDPYEEDGQDKEGIQNINVKLDFSGNIVTVTSNNEDALLYVNGKSTGKKMKDIDEFGPVKTDGSMKLQAVYQLGSHIVKSPEEPITSDGQEVYLEIPATDFVGDYYDDSEYSNYNGDSEYDGDKEAIAQAVRDHYNYISSGNYQEAYDLFSSKKQLNYDHWKRGVEKNYRNIVEISNVEQIDDTNAEVSLNLTSYDRKSDSKTLVQVWGGTWSLIYQDGHWLLNASKIKKLDSYTTNE
ncbi:zinc-ribbon domain-containing protein [Neobacillus sp. OS1-32]|uniref:zinc ribbon domain-containing protein n=1 Tax=Neobacillus sp. OS1-32 TaxID=3070682 RepID=UPI0027E0327D|nr:zinc-ribbon domain-containing protein [Neobacillus sp. OS1-32]WML29902.1 zinc-ribbon domain-containing protein [Neobacillus sp. OS1-32]